MFGRVGFVFVLLLLSALTLAFGLALEIGLVKLRDNDAPQLVVLVKDCVVAAHSEQPIDGVAPIDLVIDDGEADVVGRLLKIFNLSAAVAVPANAAQQSSKMSE